MQSSIFAVAISFLSTGLLTANEWQQTTADLITKEKPGNFGLCGVAVDHATGHVYINLSDRGVYRSPDQGKTWERHGKDFIKGRTETPGCMQLDPTGKSKHLLLPTVYGGPIGIGTKDETTWRFMTPKVSHIDWIAVDWSDPELKFVLALKHESGGKLLLSRDGGKTFNEVGDKFGEAWIFDADTAVAALPKGKTRPNGSIARSTDGGKTFQPVSDYSPVALPRLHGDALYWLVEGALVKTTDKGAIWSKVCDLKDGRMGPVFGKDAKHLFVLTKTGIIESVDAGTTWSKPLAPPKEMKGLSNLSWFDYDPVNDVLYLMKMASDLYKFPRKEKGE